MTKEYAIKRIKSIDKSVEKLFDGYLELLDQNINRSETIEDYQYLLNLLNEEIRKIIERIKTYNSERDMLLKIISSNNKQNKGE